MLGVPPGNQSCERNLTKFAGGGAFVPPRKHADDLLFNCAGPFMCFVTKAARTCTSDGNQVETWVACMPVVFP